MERIERGRERQAALNRLLQTQPIGEDEAFYAVLGRQLAEEHGLPHKDLYENLAAFKALGYDIGMIAEALGDEGLIRTETSWLGRPPTYTGTVNHFSPTGALKELSTLSGGERDLLYLSYLQGRIEGSEWNVFQRLQRTPMKRFRVTRR